MLNVCMYLCFQSNIKLPNIVKVSTQMHMISFVPCTSCSSMKQREKANPVGLDSILLKITINSTVFQLNMSSCIVIFIILCHLFLNEIAFSVCAVFGSSTRSPTGALFVYWDRGSTCECLVVCITTLWRDHDLGQALSFVSAYLSDLTPRTTLCVHKLLLTLWVHTVIQWWLVQHICGQRLCSIINVNASLC